MKCYKLLFILLCLFTCLAAGTSFAEFYPAKILELSDGTMLKGKLIGQRASDGAYIVETEDLGTVAIQEQNIINILNELDETTVDQMPDMPAQTNPSQGALPVSPRSNGNASLMMMQAQLQQLLASDPSMMQSFQELLADPEIAKIFQDPNLMQDVLSQNPEAIASNPKIQTLLQNPAMQKVLQKVGPKMLNPGQ